MADPVRFGRVVASRRAELGMTQADVAAAGGPSDLTLRKIERGETERPDFHTLRKIEIALRWKSGTASTAFHGGLPVVEGEPSDWTEASAVTTSRPGQPITGLEHGVVLRTDALADLTMKGKVLDDLPEEDLPPETLERVSELRYAIDRLTRAWIIRQAELARSRDELDGLVLVLNDHLRRPVDDRLNDPDREDLGYLRWLANYEDATIDEETLERYAQRLAARTSADLR